MAAPIAGGVISAEQIAKQNLDQAAKPQEAKQGASKFDHLMAEKAQPADKARPTQRVDQPRHVEQVEKADKATLNKVRGDAPHALSERAVDPVTAKTQTRGAVDAMTKMLSDLEKGQGVLDKLISGGLSGKDFSSSELLALQAGMYKYTQELELTGKVVEKATTGLKDTLKTQV